jgi:L-aspartate oxidase
MTTCWEASADVVVVGSGVAGLSAALEAVRFGLRAVVISKGLANETNTRWAQGGVAVVLPDGHDDDDSLPRHIDDTIVAGAGLCDVAAVAGILADGLAGFTNLQRHGAAFDVRPDGSFALTREGGHTAFRIVHAGGDATGAEIERALLASVRTKSGTLLERHVAVDILPTTSGAVAGLVVLDHAGVIGVIRAPAVLLATGGVGQMYQATTNDAVATGDGLALGLRAGAEVADLEFVQFHPTVLFTGTGMTGVRPLVTEAVRGEGAVLVDAAGTPVMHGVHPLKDLAPRDIVSAAITRRLAEAPGGVDDHVYLDATHLPAEYFKTRFPSVYSACTRAGIDPSSQPIPVAPAAHYSCGGLITSVDGRTSVRGLYAAGETARTGLHGANRLASNSLTEGFVVGVRAARAIAIDRATGGLAQTAAVAEIRIPVTEIADRCALQRAMSAYGAIGRDATGLGVVCKTLDTTTCQRTLRSRDDVENAALAMTARAVAVAAQERAESRGCHIRHDHPATDDHNWRRSLVLRLDDEDRPAISDVLDLGHAAPSTRGEHSVSWSAPRPRRRTA